ncbi:MAG: DUF302 domain-containing protein [Gammaproteobacteria bacterium]|jgi:uncharacterized protein (DUF302 family)
MKQTIIRNALLLWCLLLFGFAAQTAAAGDRMVIKPSHHSVRVTIERLQAELKKENIPVFATIDHAANAKSVGMSLRPTEVIIFGKPRLGTTLMQETQTIGIDLPLRVLVWEDERGRVWMGYTDPKVMLHWHFIKDHDALAAKMRALLDRLTNEAGSL